MPRLWRRKDKQKIAIRWKDPRTGRLHTKTVAPLTPEGEAIATEALAHFERRREAATFWDRGAGEPLPLQAVLEAWLETYEPLMAQGTRATQRAGKHALERYWGRRDLREITDAEVQRYVGHVLSDRGAATAVTHLSVLRRVIRLCIQHGRLERSPAPELGRVLKTLSQRAESERRRDSWSREEVATLLEVAREDGLRTYTLCAFALHCGSRASEMLGLTWARVHWARGEVHIAKSLQRDGSLGPVKVCRSRTSWWVPMSPEIREALEAWRRHQERGELQGRRVPERVFPLTSKQLWPIWRRVRRKAAKRRVRPLDWHCWRHTHATWALSAGYTPEEMEQWFGATAETIRRSYAHALPRPRRSFGFVGERLGEGTSEEPGRYRPPGNCSDSQAISLPQATTAKQRPNRSK